MSQESAYIMGPVSEPGRQPCRFTLIEVGFRSDARLITALSQQSWAFHVIADGACLDVPATAFWPWVAGLVGLSAPTLGPATRQLLDFDVLSTLPPGTEVIGLHVTLWDHEGLLRTATRSPAEFLDDLCRLAGRTS